MSTTDPLITWLSKAQCGLWAQGRELLPVFAVSQRLEGLRAGCRTSGAASSASTKRLLVSSSFRKTDLQLQSD